jgi:hypothetical protein
MEADSVRTPATAPLVSVLVPCWNAGRVVERALASVLDERALPLEVIVVDDASTDDSLARIGAVATRDPRVVVVALAENGGVSNARNRGLDRARGQWLTFLDADDRFVGGGIGRLAAVAEESDALAVVGQQVWSDGSRTWVSDLYDIPDIRAPGRKSVAASPGLLYYVSPHAKLFHRSLVDGLRFEGRVLGDQPWVIRALLRAGDRIEVIGETVYEWTRAGAERGDTPSITATTRSTAIRGVEAAAVARDAFAAVREEATRLMPEVSVDRVSAAYLERLIRSDLAAHLSGAVKRRDAAIGDLLEALADFVRGVPRPLVRTASGTIVACLLEPPLERWQRMAEPTWPAYWSLLAAVAAADRHAWRAAAPPLRMPLRIAGSGRLRARRAAAVVFLRARRRRDRLRTRFRGVAAALRRRGRGSRPRRSRSGGPKTGSHG